MRIKLLAALALLLASQSLALADTADQHLKASGWRVLQSYDQLVSHLEILRFRTPREDFLKAWQVQDSQIAGILHEDAQNIALLLDDDPGNDELFASLVTDSHRLYLIIETDSLYRGYNKPSGILYSASKQLTPEQADVFRSLNPLFAQTRH